MKTKNFDSVGFMRRRRIEIEKEDAGLGWEDRQKKTLEILADDPLWQSLRGRQVKATPAGAAREGRT